jgi:hypothetical protein
LAPYVYNQFTHVDPASGVVIHEAITELGYKGIVSWSMWAGAVILVSSGLVSFAMQGRAVFRAFKSLRRSVSHGEENPLNRIEVPNS